ncbi:MAG: S-methyl-5-thioribose-1-phosphate isomerase, partial [Deltaproteobacteria bacterium]|nr:S-methyl-5-thioribose-1-phosphate isomerase [Deltaproteobacteria bacterium]
MKELRPLIWKSGRLFIIDQRLLPAREKWVELKSEKDVFRAIRDMLIRGAPAIGIVAAFGFYLGFRKIKKYKREILENKASEIAAFLNSARPTACLLYTS